MSDKMREAKNALDRLFNGAVLQGYPRKTAEYLREAIEAALSQQPSAHVPEELQSENAPPQYNHGESIAWADGWNSCRKAVAAPSIEENKNG